MRSSRARSFVEQYELKTGKELTQQIKLPAGKLIRLRRVWSDDDADNESEVVHVITSQREWAKTCKELFQGAKKGPKSTDKIDFSREYAVVISLGRVGNCSGIGADSCFVDKSRTLL